MASSPIKPDIRAAIPEDIPFILNSWKQSWRTSPWAGCLRNDEYFDATQSTIDGLIARGAQLLVATLGGRILGWLCYELLPDGLCCIHYVYVKDFVLKTGIEQDLLAEAKGRKPGLYTHRYQQVANLCRGADGWAHRPEVARRK